MKNFLFATMILGAVVFVGCTSNGTREMPTRSMPQAYPGVIETFPYEAPVRTNPRQYTGGEVNIETPIVVAGESASGILGRYETEFDTSDSAREVNILLAARAIDNTIVASGETFSFNDTIGSTTAERGYKSAVIFVDGEKSEGYGGGVCQVSTTLCNAASQAGMTIIERHDHSLPVEYVRDGLQAATSHNSGLDFRFRNDTGSPIKINAIAENGRIAVKILEPSAHGARR